jgi:hypothetical protein
MQIVPKTGLKGLVENWQSDLLASISVALVALPLGLAVAFASGFEPIAGIILLQHCSEEVTWQSMDQLLD